MTLTKKEKNIALEMLTQWYAHAEQAVNNEQYAAFDTCLTSVQAETIHRLGKTNHASRGAALTLCLSQAMKPNLDVRFHKAELGDGFSARSVDENATVPFLAGNGLPHSVQSHWMTRTLANDTPYYSDTVLKTVPKTAGPDLIKVANYIHDYSNKQEQLEAIGQILLLELIKERNRGKVPVTHPKGLSINQVISLLHSHFNAPYKKNAPRLPQIAIYAIYQCLMKDVERYRGCQLESLQKMKSADRKSGSFGDVVVTKDNHPVEAVEIKYNIPIDRYIVTETMQKVQSQSVERYFILSTAPQKEDEKDPVRQLAETFLKSNGCEIVVNGVYETIKYYLRLLKSTNEFINNYTDLLEADTDLGYEHKVSWNLACAEL